MNVLTAEQDQLPVAGLCCFADGIEAELGNDGRGFDVIVPIHPQSMREDVFLGWLLAVDSAEQGYDDDNLE